MKQMETIESTANMIEPKGIKLSKGMKGAYSWEIKINTLDIDELERLNKEMLKRFSISE
jgi:hypothetical protein